MCIGVVEDSDIIRISRLATRKYSIIRVKYVYYTMYCHLASADLCN